MKNFFKKINRIFQDYMREKRLKIGKAIWDKKEKTNIIKGNNFIEDNNIKSILFLRYDGKIGDMIVNSLMFREIKKVYPYIKIGLIARGAAIDIIKDNPNVDEIYEYHKDRKKIKELALKIREENYDLLIDFSEMLRVNQMMLINLCGARINIGIEKENWKLFDISLNIRDFNQHISELYIKILKFLGIDNINSSYDVFSSNYLLKDLNLENKKYCVFNPYAASKHRSFSSENIEKISKIILEKNYEKLILIGNEDKIKELKKLDISKENKVKIIETKGMSEVAELIKGADLVVSPDTSIVHLGKAFDKKMICIYRKELGKEDKNSILWGPNSEKAKIIFVEEKTKDGEEININNLNLDEFKKEIGKILY